MSTTAVITGLGIASSHGVGAEDHWSGVIAGRSALGPVRAFDTTPYPQNLAGEVPSFVAADHLPSRLVKQTDRMTQLALVAAEEALDDAGVRKLVESSPFDIGVITASSSGGFEFGQGELQKLWSLGGDHVSAYQSFAWFYAVNTGQISIRQGLKGIGSVLVSDAAGGLDALGHAVRHVRKGTPVIVTGGFDGGICPWGWTALATSGRLSEASGVEDAYLPFDRRAGGYVPAEGGALLVVEDEEHARARSATPYGRVLAQASTFEPDEASPDGIIEAITRALDRCGVSASDVDVVFADAAGSVDLDRAEADALTKVFGAGQVPVTAPKVGFGRTCSGAGALDVATAVLAFMEGRIPPTPHTRADAAPDLDLVLEARDASLDTAVVVARGVGGFISALVLGTPNWRSESPR